MGYTTNGKIHFAKPPCVRVAFLPDDRNTLSVAVVTVNKFQRLHKHTAAAAAGVYKRAKNDTNERNPCLGCIWVHF